MLVILRFVASAILLMSASAAGLAQSIPATAPTAAEQDLEGKRVRMMKSMKPVCLKRDADIKAGRKPKEFSAFLLSLPASYREEVKLICDST